MNRLLRNAALASLDGLGINALFRFVHRKGALILLYHGVANDDYAWPRGYDDRHVSRSLFRQHLLFLKRKGYTFVTLTELLRALEEERDERKLATISLDDGFENVVTNAYPIMRELDAKGCVYVCSDLIGSERLLWPDEINAVLQTHPEPTFRFRFRQREIIYNLEADDLRNAAVADVRQRLRMLSNRERFEHLQQFHDHAVPEWSSEFRFPSWAQLRELDRGVLEVAAHTRTHADCVSLASEEELEDELVRSKEEIERQMGCSVPHFAYPFGSYDDRVLAYVRNAGYESAVSTMAGFNDAKSDRYQLKRMCGGGDFMGFKASASGSAKVVLEMRDVLSRAG